jgi:alpha-D-ribose 1-methylphosphonate 5-triphosphate synthase subunit PhnH
LKLDLVHDVQIIYRKMIDSTARPGTISQLQEQAEKLELETGCLKSTLLLALVLLDTEVTFAMIGEESARAATLINQLTYAKESEVHEADYIFILRSATTHQGEQAILAAKIGDLVNPHHAATLIIEADEVSQDRDLLLSGPGIKEVSPLQVTTKLNWLEPRSTQNREYPMGIDMILVDPEHHTVCLPRTTQIRRQVLV